MSLTQTFSSDISVIWTYKRGLVDEIRALSLLCMSRAGVWSSRQGCGLVVLVVLDAFLSAVSHYVHELLEVP
jgi:hypothetical protein